MNERDAFLDAATGYLASHQRKDGRFAYRARPDGQSVRNDYNTLRHAGTIYALCSAEHHVSSNLSQTIDRALEYLWRWYLVPVPGSSMQFAIASGRRGQKAADVAKIGGMGLALIALCSVNRPLSAFEASAAEGMVRYARTLIRDDGSMVNKVDYRTGEESDFVSLYYPGEVALGFLLYGIRQNDTTAVDTCIRILTYLADTRRPFEDVPPDHWALLATARLFLEARAGSVRLDEATEAFLYYHGIQVTEKVLRIADAAPDPVGSLVKNGQCCSIATRLEGLTAMQPWLARNDYPSLDKVNQRIGEGISYLIASQYRDGSCEGGVPWIPTFHPDAPKKDIAPEVRIDTVQHSISAVLGAKALSEKTTA